MDCSNRFDSFEKIINNCEYNINTIFDKSNLTEDSLKYVEYLLDSNIYNKKEPVKTCYVKYIYEIISRFQQILDQFVIKTKKKKEYNNKKTKFNRLFYLISYLYNNKDIDPTYYNLLKKSFSNNEDTIAADNICKKLKDLHNNYNSEYINNVLIWFNFKGIQFHKNLANVIRDSSDKFIRELFNTDVIKKIYNSYPSIFVQNEIEQKKYDLYNYTTYFTVYNSNKDKLEYILNLDITQKINKKIKYFIAFSLLLSVLVENTNNVNILCIKSLQKKKFPDSFKTLGANEVNSGFTKFDYNGDNNITIYRDEEKYKLVIHECIHSLNLDIHGENCDNIHNWLKEHFLIKKDSKILINECYVELWAVFINSILSAHLICPQYVLCTIIYIIYLEKLFSCFQSARILNFYGFNSFQEFYNENGWTNSNINNIKYSEDSSVLSYYIIKSSILFSINNFLDYCNDNSNGTFKDFIKFKYYSLNNFLKLIKNSLNNSEFQKIINKFIIKIKKDKNKQKYKEIYKKFNSLRMTIIECKKIK